MRTSNSSERIKEAMALRHMRQTDVLEAAEKYTKETGVKLHKSDLSQYISGKCLPGQSKLYLLGKIFNVDPVWLMGIDVPMNAEEKASRIPSEAIQIVTHKVPLIGATGCGIGQESPEYEESVDADQGVHADYALRCVGDSMIGARICDGDIVFIQDCQDVDDGDIAAVSVDNEVLLKRVYHLNGALMLQSDNPKYKPRLVGANGETVRIMGKAIAFRSNLI